MANSQEKVVLQREKDPVWSNFLELISQELINNLEFWEKDVVWRVYYVRHWESKSQSESWWKLVAQSWNIWLSEKWIGEIKKVWKLMKSNWLNSKNTLILYYDDTKRAVESVEILKWMWVWVDCKDERLKTTSKVKNKKWEMVNKWAHVEISGKMLIVWSKLMEEIKKILSTHKLWYNIILLWHKANKAWIVESATKVRPEPIQSDGNIETGEIMEFDINWKWEYIRYKFFWNILNIRLDNIEEIRKDFESESWLNEILKWEKQLREKQNEINKYFEKHSELYEKYVFSGCFDLKVFCAVRLIEEGKFDKVLNNIFDIIKNISDDKIWEFMQIVANMLEKDDLKRLIDKLNTSIEWNAAIQSIKQILEFYIYSIENIDPKIKFLRRKSLDKKINSWAPITFSVWFEDNKYEDIPLLIDWKWVVLIQWDAGSGKSIKMLELLEYSKANNIRVKYLHLWSLWKNDDDEESDEIKEVIKELNKWDLILLDALDEAMLSEEKKKQLFSMLKWISNKKRIVITSRPGGLPQFKYEVDEPLLWYEPVELEDEWEKEMVLPQIEYLNMKPLSIEQVYLYINSRLNEEQKIVWEKLKNSDFIKDIETNPLMLNMICDLIIDKENFEEIKTRWDLYERIVEKRLIDWEDKKGTRNQRLRWESKISYDEKKEIYKLSKKISLLKELANFVSSPLYGWRPRESRIRPRILERHIIALRKKYTLREEIDCLNLVFRKNEKGEYDFVHESFREYFSILSYLEDIDIRNGAICPTNINISIALIKNLFYYWGEKWKEVLSVLFDKKDNYHYLSMACKEWLMGLVKFVIEILNKKWKKISVKILGDLFRQSINSWNLELVKYLFDLFFLNGGRYLDIDKSHKQAAIILAFENWNIELVKYLIWLKYSYGERVFDMSGSFHYEGSFLMIVYKSWNVDFLKYLIELKDEYWKRIFNLNEIDRYIDKEPIIYRVIKSCNLEGLKYFLELKDMNWNREIKLDYIDKIWKNLLMKLGFRCGIDWLRYLIELRDKNWKRIFDLKQKTKRWDNLLMIVCDEISEESHMKYLIDQKDENWTPIFDLQEKNNDWESLLDLVKKSWNAELVKYIESLYK